MAHLGHEGEPEIVTIPSKKPRAGHLSIEQKSCNTVHGALRETTGKALRRYRDCPSRIGEIVAAAVVLLHHEHSRTAGLNRSRSHNATKGCAETLIYSLRTGGAEHGE